MKASLLDGHAFGTFAQVLFRKVGNQIIFVVGVALVDNKEE